MFGIIFTEKKTKKTVILLIILILVVINLALYAVYTQKGLQQNKDRFIDDSKGNMDEKEKFVVFPHKSINYYFHIIVHESVKRAVEARGWKFQSVVADFDSDRQINQFINFIPMKPDAIISNPIDSDALVDVINKAADNEIPVCIVDTPTTGGNVTVTVSFDNFLAGKMAAEEIILRLKEKYGKARGTVFNAYGYLNSMAYRLRKKGFESVIKQYPNIRYISMPGEGDLAKTHDVFVKALEEYKEIDAVHCPSDTPARGIVEALKQIDRWKKINESEHIIFVTIDGDPAALKYISKGYYDASIVQDAISYGEIVGELLDNYILSAESITLSSYKNDKYYWEEAIIKNSASGLHVVIPPYVMDKSNYSDPRHWANIAEKEWGFEYR